MTDWAYQIETYKTTMHFYEVLTQSLTWPVILVIIPLLFRLMFWSEFRSLLNDRRIQSLGIGSFSVNLTGKEAIDTAINDLKKISQNTTLLQEKEKIEQVINTLEMVNPGLSSHYAISLSKSKHSTEAMVEYVLRKMSVVIYLSALRNPDYKSDDVIYYVILGIAPADNLERLADYFNKNSGGVFTVAKIQPVTLTIGNT